MGKINLSLLSNSFSHEIYFKMFENTRINKLFFNKPVKFQILYITMVKPVMVYALPFYNLPFL